MATSRIEELIEDIYDFVEDCKAQPFATSKVIVPKDQLYDFLDELRLRMPEEIKRYQKMLENKDAILARAQEEADGILAAAQQKMDALVDEHQIMQQAYAQADEIVMQAQQQAQEILAAAEEDAHQIRTGAIAYTEDMLVGLENIMDKAYSDCKSHYEGLLGSMQENLDIVRTNHRELTGEPTPVAQSSTQKKEIHHEEVLGEYPLEEEY